MVYVYCTTRVSTCYSRGKTRARWTRFVVLVMYLLASHELAFFWCLMRCRVHSSIECCALLFMSVKWDRFDDVMVRYRMYGQALTICIVRLWSTGCLIEWKCHHVATYKTTLVLVLCYLAFRNFETARETTQGGVAHS